MDVRATKINHEATERFREQVEKNNSCKTGGTTTNRATKTNWFGMVGMEIRPRSKRVTHATNTGLGRVETVLSSTKKVPFQTTFKKKTKPNH